MKSFRISEIVAYPMLAAIKIYQFTLGQLFPGNCRFHPTCSQYAFEAIKTHGAFKGGWFALRRISRCHPWNPGGFDPVPPFEER